MASSRKIRFYFNEGDEETLLSSKTIASISGSLEKEAIVDIDKGVYFVTDKGNKLLISDVIIRIEDFTRSIVGEGIEYSWFTVCQNQFIFKSSVYGHVEWLSDAFHIIEGEAIKYEQDIAEIIFTQKAVPSNLFRLLFDKIDIGLVIVEVM